MVQKRFTRLEDDLPLKSLLAEYMYHTMALPGSGEYVLKLILKPGAKARRPLVDRIGILSQFQGAVSDYQLEPPSKPKLEAKRVSIDMNAVMENPIDPSQDAMAQDCIQRLKSLQTLFISGLIG